MPLDQMLERVGLCALEVVRPVEGIEPHVEEEASPVAATHNEAFLAKSLAVLCNNEIDITTVGMPEGAYDAVGGYNRFVDEENAFQPCRVHYVIMNCQGRVHDQGVLPKVEEEGAVRVDSHGVAHGGKFCPRGRRLEVAQIVVGGIGEECRIVCGGGVSTNDKTGLKSKGLTYYGVQRT